MGLVYFLSTIAGCVVLAIIAHIFARALTALMITGHWPHQSKEAQDVFRKLP